MAEHPQALVLHGRGSWANQPTLYAEWCGGTASGYLWLGLWDEPHLHFTTVMSKAQARRLRDFLTEHIDGRQGSVVRALCAAKRGPAARIQTGAWGCEEHRRGQSDG